MVTQVDLIGEQIDQFQLDEFIAKGSMGLVFKARDTILKRTVALKLISRTEDITPAMAVSRNRLIKEAQAAARLLHDNIVTVFCYGETETFQYIAMEYIVGTTLAQVLNQRGLLPVEEALPIFDQILVALEAASREQITHRDIKPANIMITEGGRVKVMDFGIAKLEALDSYSSTATGVVLGTPYYMSPEQIRGQKVDIRSDLFALGAMLYEVLTGVRPFEADTLATLVYKILQEEPTLPTALNEHFPKGLEKIILRALAKDSGKRYQTPGEMRQALHAFPGQGEADEELAVDTLTDSTRVMPESHQPSQPSAVEPRDLASSPASESGTRHQSTGEMRQTLPALPQQDKADEELGVETLIVPTPAIPESHQPSQPSAAEPVGVELSHTPSAEEVLPSPPDIPVQIPSPADRISPPKTTKRSRALGMTIGLVALVVIGLIVYMVELRRKPDISPATLDLGKTVPGQPEPQMPTSKDGRPTEEIGQSAGKDQKETALQPPGVTEPSSAEAQYETGRRYAYGDGVKRDHREALKWYRLAADQGYARAQNALGVMYAMGAGVATNYQEAVRWYRLAADQNYAEAQGNVGFMYENGLGVEKDHREASRWYRNAAEQGEVKAQAALGRMYETGLGVGKDYQEAAKWYRLAANQGHARAQNNLGVLYRNGYGVEKNQQQALIWYRKAAEQGYAIAQSNLGFSYQYGQGVEKNYEEAFKWYRLAADQGHAIGQNNLGTMYQNGFGVEKDNQEALKWYRKAADQGYAIAQANLGFMYKHGYGVKSDYQEALKWYGLAADQGNAKAQNDIGVMYISGHGVQKNYQEALKWYRKAAVQGYAVSQVNLAIMYKNGHGVAKNSLEAMTWFQKAAEQGNPNAQRNLGFMYEKGEGGQRDRAKAIGWYQKAADQGDHYSIQALKRLRP